MVLTDEIRVAEMRYLLANRRWLDRYAAVESLAAERGLILAELDAAAKDALWNEVKMR